MAPSEWGHPSIPVCHNPPCSYARTEKVARLNRRLAAVMAAPVLLSPQASVSKKLIRESGLTRLARLLGDGKPHLVSECRTVAKCGDSVAVFIMRLRERYGFDIVTRRAANKAASYQLVSTERL